MIRVKRILFVTRPFNITKLSAKLVLLFKAVSQFPLA